MVVSLIFIFRSSFYRLKSPTENTPPQLACTVRVMDIVSIFEWPSHISNSPSSLYMQPSLIPRPFSCLSSLSWHITIRYDVQEGYDTA